jgi:hypothetical protein
MHGLMRWLGKRGYHQYWLDVSGTFGLHYPMASTDEQHLERITKAIKQAMRNRYATLRQAEPAANLRKRHSMSTQ